MRTLGEALRATARRLAGAALHFGHGTGSAREEAAWLVAHVTRTEFDELSARDHDRLPARTWQRIDALTSRRIRTRRPLAQILGEAWYLGRRFQVNRHVLVPRSHIGALVPQAIAPWLSRTPRRCLDLCTGSGCLAVHLAAAYPRATIDASDLSAAALAVARRNVVSHRMRNRIRLVRSDLFASLDGRSYDLIVCNPPYVTARTMKTLPAEYRHEPRIALAAGLDGLEVIRRVLAGVERYLAPRGIFVCEIGRDRRALERAFPRLAFIWLEVSGGHVFLLERSALVTP